MTREQLLNDQRHLFTDLPVEEIVIGTQAIPCLIISARQGNRWEDGGLIDGPGLSVVIERRNIVTMPKQGDQAMFRLQAYRVATVQDDHETSPVRVELESVTGSR